MLLPFRRVSLLREDLRVRFTEPSMALLLIARIVDLDYTRGKECRPRVDVPAALLEMFRVQRGRRYIFGGHSRLE